MCLPGALVSARWLSSIRSAKRKKAPSSLPRALWSAKHCAHAPSMSVLPCSLQAHPHQQVQAACRQRPCYMLTQTSG